MQVGELLDARDGAAEDGDVGEEHVVVDLLEEVGADLGQRHLPQIASTGAGDFLASYRPLRRWIAPGPTVPMQTASRPVSCACAPAAKAPASSWRTPIQSIPSWRRIASVTGLSASPTTPQTGDALLGERGDERSATVGTVWWAMWRDP